MASLLGSEESRGGTDKVSTPHHLSGLRIHPVALSANRSNFAAAIARYCCFALSILSRACPVDASDWSFAKKLCQSRWESIPLDDRFVAYELVPLFTIEIIFIHKIPTLRGSMVCQSKRDDPARKWQEDRADVLYEGRG